jgi:hypothetical protein
MRWAGHAAQVEKRNAYRLLVGKSEGKRQPGRPRHRWVDLRETECDGVVWNGLIAQDRDRWIALVKMVMSIWVP